MEGIGHSCFGADAVIFQQKDDCLLAHRIQVKLGKGTSNQRGQIDQVNEVINRFNTMDRTMKTAYQTRPALEAAIP
ncbi:hypothetical protein HDU85_001973 [Gaertneriomyces sp. JEL0708]|nr:hypothetical protein HDU85_001973 [Gaertneriomyces sp. JEL0708]